MITVYPDEGYNSFVSIPEASVYFDQRVHADEFTEAASWTAEAAIVTAFRSLNELNIIIDPTEPAQLQALKDAQCEQALHELKEDVDFQNLKVFAIQGIKATKTEVPRYSERALSILRPYLQAPVIQVVR